MPSNPLILAAAALALSALHAPPAAAANATRNVSSHGAANCQSALPVFDGQIRKRPKAVANEGTGNAFVTCDWEGVPLDLEAVGIIRVHFINQAATAQDVTCTLVQASGYTDYAPAMTKTRSVSPGSYVFTYWDPDDFGGNGITAPAVSCMLRPGMAIAGTGMTYSEYVGE